MIAPFNLQTKEKNVAYEFKNKEGKVSGVIYGEKTDELNYTEIEIPCLKHYRYEFETSVKTQLLFFSNVSFYRQYEGLGEPFEIDFKSELIGDSFHINNPKVKSSCGCGISFSL